jgi:PAS domain S-box-containing protein
MDGGDYDPDDTAMTLEALERSGERFRELIEAVPAVIYEAEPGLGARWRYVSPQLESLIGDAPEAWMGNPDCYTMRLHPADRNAVFHVEEQELQEARRRGSTCVSEYRMIHRDGQVVWVRDEARLMDGRTGDPFWRGVLVDITVERAARTALAETFERYRGERRSRAGQPRRQGTDVFRVTCASCGAVRASEDPGRCLECGSQAVQAESLDALARQLEVARRQVDDLLDGIHRHLEMLGTSLHAEAALAGRRVVTALPHDPLAR